MTVTDTHQGRAASYRGPERSPIPGGSPAQYLSDAVQLAKALGGKHAVRDLPAADPAMPLADAARLLAAAAMQLVTSSLNDKKANR